MCGPVQSNKREKGKIKQKGHPPLPLTSSSVLSSMHIMYFFFVSSMVFDDSNNLEDISLRATLFLYHAE